MRPFFYQVDDSVASCTCGGCGEILGNALGRTAALSPAFATAYARNIVINNTPGE